MICTFSDPRSIGTGGIEKPAGVSDNFQYKTVTCIDSTTTTIPGQTTTTGPDRYQLITGTNGKTFFLDKSISYGQYINIAMLLIFFFIITIGILYSIIYRRKY